MSLNELPNETIFEILSCVILNTDGLSTFLSLRSTSRKFRDLCTHFLRIHCEKNGITVLNDHILSLMLSRNNYVPLKPEDELYASSEEFCGRNVIWDSNNRIFVRFKFQRINENPRAYNELQDYIQYPFSTLTGFLESINFDFRTLKYYFSGMYGTVCICWNKDHNDMIYFDENPFDDQTFHIQTRENFMKSSFFKKLFWLCVHKKYVCEQKGYVFTLTNE